MTALAKSQADSEIAAEIARMAALLAMPSGGVMTEHLASEYVQALRPFPIWAIRDTSVAFRFGRVGEGKWMPRPGEFAVEVRRRVDDHHRIENHKRAEQRQIAEGRQYRENIAAARTPEAMVAFKELRERQLAKRAAEEQDEAERRLKANGGSGFEKVHARFDQIARQELIRHLAQQDKERAREWAE